jgi:hypothetical protein
MAKGKFGISLTALAILAFVMCFFDLTVVLVLLVAYAFLIEKDEWLTRQAFQALYLNIAYIAAITVVGWVFSFLITILNWVKAYGASAVLSEADNFIKFLLGIALFVCALLAVLRLLKDKNASLPVLGKLTDYTMGIIEKQAAPPPQAAPAFQTPAPAQPQQAPYQSPAYVPQPSAPAPQVPAAPVIQIPPPAEPAPAPFGSPFQQAAPAPAPVTVFQEPAPVPSPWKPVVPAPVAKAAEQPPVFSAAAEPAAPAEAPQTAPASGYWICSCGRENWGNFCVTCGNPRKV